ncbi:MAG: HEPN domain-containing protein [Bacteroidales bacterium]|nr:HEPN domain-containing protein [Bacteroidales bacterium]
MRLNEEERRIVVGLEIEKSRRTFAEIKILRQAGLWNNIANRLFYSAYHAVTALLISEGYPAGSHQGTVIQFHQYFIKTGILPISDGAFYSQMQTLREKADYNCTYYATEEDTVPRIAETEDFIDRVIGVIKEQYKETDPDPTHV